MHTGIKIKAIQSDNEKEVVKTCMDCALKESGTVLRNKYGPDRGLERRKACVVAKGLTQLKIIQFDIETAYWWYYSLCGYRNTPCINYIVCACLH